MINLRKVSLLQNKQNRLKRAPAASSFRGVSYNIRANRWTARVSVDYHRVFVGSFKTELEAHLAVTEARKRLMTHSVEG